MKYIIDIPEYGLVPYNEPDRNDTYLNSKAWMDGYENGIAAGRDDAWKFAKNLLNYTDKDWEDLMNLLLIDKCSYQEAKEKYEKWKREKNEIQIGDEVEDKEIGIKGIVTFVLTSHCDVLWLDGSVSEDISMSELCKTGKHFGEVKDLLKKIKEES